MTDLVALRSFVAVVDHGSVVEAARATGYSTTAVSRHLAALERDLGVALFRRGARAIHPTVGARVLSERARLLLEEADHFDRSARALARGEEGTIRLAYFQAAGKTVVPPTLALLRAKSPGTRVLLVECPLSEDVEEKLARGEADVGFLWDFPAAATAEPSPSTIGRSTVAGLERIPLFSEALVLLTADDREDLHEDPTDLVRLSGENFAMAPGHVGSPPHVDRLFLAHGLPAPTVSHRPSDHGMLRSLVSAGLVVCLIPALGVSDTLPGVRRSVSRFDFRRISVAHHAGTRDPLVVALTDAIVRACSEYSGFGVRYVGPARG